jgi:hypothetical protein
MNIKHLAQTLDYKKVFNCIYKNYIKGNRQYDKDSIIKLDFYFRQLYSSLKEQKSSEEIKDKVIKVRCIDFDVIDIYIYEITSKNYYTLNFCSLVNLSLIKIDNSIEIPNEELLSHLLWDIMSVESR